MAKPGSGKRQMQAVRKKQHNATMKSLRSAGKDFKKAMRAGKKASKGCYIATCVYGNYDCPEVWSLRRYRDDVLEKTWVGRLFIRIYYSISPKLVVVFGNNERIRNCWKSILDKIVTKLNKKGISSDPYVDQ